ncbi:MAG: MG2 domain-containing protein, partial [Alphaproteobacteria bacterium]
MLISLRLSFVAFLFAALFGSAGTALAQGLMPGKSLVDARLDVADAFEFAELASASEVLGDSTYLMVFNPPTYDDQWRRLNQNYRLLLALTLDEEADGRAALLAAATAMNGERDDHAQALALEALGKLEAEEDRALATAIIDMLTGRIQKRYSGQQRDRLWQLARQIGPFGPFRATAAQEGDYARLCARFSQSIEASHRVDYRDLVTVSPRPPVERFVVLDGGRQLCLVGAEFERTYDLTIREGLKAKNGTRLRETVAFNLTTPGRNPELRLPGQGYVLPASGTQLVPIETVNQDALKVQLFHLDERNITQVLRRGILAQNTADITDPRDIYEYIEERTGTFRDRVSEVFEGTLSINMLKHQRRRDGISIAEMIDGPAKRGLYLLTLQGKDDSDVKDLKWIMVSDLALTTVDTPEGLFINAVDTRNGAPVFENVAVEMVTRGNRVMQPVATDDAATAFFAASQLKGQNGDEPLYLYASHPELGDAFLALGRAPIEIETESGLPTLKSGALDLWAKTDRGQYREGETARVAGLLRQTRPSQDVLMPKTLLGRVLDPNGDVVQTMNIDLSAANGFEAEVALPFGARQGRWSLNISLGEGLPSLRSVSIPVADFVPPSVEIELAELPALRFDGTDEITVQVDYLFGAPAKNLSVNLRGRLAPKPNIEGFNIGLAQEEFVFARPFDLYGRTEKDGSVTFTLPAYRLPDQTALGVIGIEAVVTDASGRQERVNGLAELASEDTFVGLKPAFDIDRPVEEGSEVTFTAAALLGDGSLTTGKADWVLYREIYDYNWYFDGGRWNYESSYIDLPVSEGTLDLDGETPLSVDVDWGAYRIEIVDQNGLSATSLRFNAGWRALPQVDRAPGRLGVTVSTAEPQPGDSIDIVIDSPFAGAGLVYLVGSETHVESLGTLSEGSNDLSLTLPESWDNAEGLWLLPVVYSQGATGVDQLPARAVGASFVGFDHSPVTLDLALETDDEVKPRETLTVPVSIGALAEGETAYALSWIVDDGVLKMTGYQSPDPLKHFLDPYALPADHAKQ